MDQPAIDEARPFPPVHVLIGKHQSWIGRRRFVQPSPLEENTKPKPCRVASAMRCNERDALRLAADCETSTSQVWRDSGTAKHPCSRLRSGFWSTAFESSPACFPSL